MRLLLFGALLLTACEVSKDDAANHSGHAAPPAEPAPPPGHEGHGAAASTQLPQGYSEITITPERQQLIGIKTVKVTSAPLAGSIRASAVVQADETKEAHVHTKIMGWVQELFVKALGEAVEKGQALYSLYSQELFAAQQEYLNAVRQSPELAQAARQRLFLWDVPESELRRIERDGPQKAIRFVSPVSGTVVEKNVLQGHYVDAGSMLYRIADLSRVWVIAETYEFEAPRLKQGAVATVSVQGVAGAFTAPIDYVYPTVSETTRTVRVRLVLDNPRGALRPGAFATVELPTTASSGLVVPREAIIDTGTRKIAFLALHGGRFRPIEVVLGGAAGELVEVRSGLAQGDEVVVSAQFLLDSESRLRGQGQSKHGGH